MTKLVIIEAPNKIKTISKILGSDYVVRATVGHIIDLAKGKGNDIGVDIAHGFKPKYEVLEDKRDKIKAIVDAAKSATEIFIASDNDREGEAIAYHVNSQISHLGKTIKRAVFNEITKAAVLKAIANPRDIDQNLVTAQQARRVVDRIVGYMVSPYLSKKMGDGLSAGRVQSVALRLVVEREREIEAFIPEEFFTITATLNKEGQKFEAKYVGKVTDEAKATEIKDSLLKAKFIVSDIKSQQRLRPPAAPMTTSTLQQEASAKFKFDAERTMKAAQALYESGQVTYIRSDSTRNSPESIKAVREYLAQNKYTIPNEPNTFKNKDAAQDAHEAIRPTDVNMLPEKMALDEDQKKIYELIWCMFVASQMTPAVYDTVNVTIKAGEHELKAEGKILRDSGWLQIAKNFIKKEADVSLPPLKQKDELSLVTPKVVVEKKKTQPPSRFNDGTLVKELDKKEIGRPSTYASIISRISNRKYVKKTTKGFQPTDLGKQVVDDLKQFFSFMDYKYTANMEKKLDDLADGSSDYLSMMTEFFDHFRVEFQTARGNQGMETPFSCPNCHGKTVVRKSSYGYFASCIAYPECKGTISINMVDGQPVLKGSAKKTVEGVVCPEPGCGAGMILREDGKFGPFYSCSNYPKCLGKRKVPFGKKCPKCKNELYANLMSGKMKLACIGYPQCKHVEDLPEGSKVNWVNPEEVTPPKYSKKVEKVLK